MNTLALYLALFMLGLGVVITVAFVLVAVLFLVSFLRGCFMPAEKGGGVR